MENKGGFMEMYWFVKKYKQVLDGISYAGGRRQCPLGDIS
jgi:hypothetical protein